MTFDLEREQARAATRLRRKLEEDVTAANARIRRYTPTEKAEAEAGLRPTEMQATLRRTMSGFEEVGYAWRGMLESIKAAAEAFNRGFENWGKMR